MQYCECAYVSVLEEYTGPLKPGHILHIMHIMHILNYVPQHGLDSVNLQ